MHFAVAIAQVDVLEDIRHLRNLVWLDAHQRQMRDIAIGPHHRRHADVVDKLSHGIDGIDQRQLERLEFQGDF